MEDARTSQQIVTTSTPKITMLISCHKSFSCPANSLFLPVQVGAANTSTRVEGAQADNEGENISNRNSSFSEMTGQYWAWKNLDADYVGQCHYRRYFYFGDAHHAANDHAQIEVESLCPRTHREFGLDDETLLRDVVGCYDLITPIPWDVRLVDTPSGPQETVGKHMLGYDLVDAASLQLLLRIVDERQPQWSKAVRTYLSGHSYLGYNCFMMRHDLFDELCAFEFDVLCEFDRRFDYEGRTVNQARVCGYMGEILVSAFEQEVARREGIRTAQYPLVFFMNTDSAHNLEHLVDTADVEAGRTLVALWQPDEFYEYDIKKEKDDFGAIPAVVESLTQMGGTALARTAVFLPECSHGWRIEELLSADARARSILVNSETFVSATLNEHARQLLDLCPEVFMPLLAPWLIPNAQHVLWIGGDAVVCDDTSRMIHALDGCCISAIPAYSWAAGLTCNAAEWVHRLVNLAGLNHAYELLSPDALMIDAQAMRESTSWQSIVDTFDALHTHLQETNAPLGPGNPARHRDPVFEEREILFNAIVNKLGLAINNKLPAYDAVPRDRATTWMPKELLSSWREAAQNPCAVVYRPGTHPTYHPQTAAAAKFWRVVRATPAYELCMAELSVHFSEKPAVRNRAIDAVLPLSSKRRSMVKLATRKLRKILGRGPSPQNHDVAPTLHHANDHD